MPAIPAIIGGGASIVGGLIQGHSAKSAAQQQAEAAAKVAEMAQKTGEQGATDVTNAGIDAAGNVTAAANTAAGNVTQAGQNAGLTARLSADEANALLRSIYGDAFSTLQPYRDAGSSTLSTLSDYLKAGGEFNKPFEFDPEQDPGYKFRLQQGEQALLRSRAAMGSLAGGGTLKDLTEFAQGLASQEYQNSFNRFQTDRANRFGMLKDIAGLGMKAGEDTIAAGQNYGNLAAGNIMNAGQFKANAEYQSTRDAGNYTVGGADAAARYKLGSVGDAARLRMAGTQIAGDALTDAASSRAAGAIRSGNAWKGIADTAGGTFATAWGKLRPPKPSVGMGNT